MKKQLLMLGMIFLPTLAMAASPDFNGAWVRNKANSDPAPNLTWTTRSANATGGGGRGNAEVILTVHQNAKDLNVVDSQSFIHDYTLDGAPHTKPTETGIEKAVVTATLQGDNSLVIETTEPYGGMPGNATLKVKEVWVLSPDGKTLTITTTRDVAARQQTFKQVYDWTQAQPAAICSAGCVVPK